MADDRPIYVYQVPARIADECGVKEVGLVQLSAREQLDAIDRSHGKATRVVFEYVYSSFWTMDGVKLSLADGSVEKAWSKCSPALRELIVGAYGSLHTPVEGEQAAFMMSRRVVVG